MADYSDERAERILREHAASNGFNNWMGVRLVAAGNGQVETEIDIKPEMQQHHGFVHGGVVGALADTNSAWAAGTVAGDVVTSTYTLQLLAPAKGVKLRGRAKTIKAGRRNVSVEAQVYSVAEDGTSKLVATSLASIATVKME